MITVEDNLFHSSKLLKITENQTFQRTAKLLVADFSQNELHEGYVIKSKSSVQFVKSTTRTKMMKGRCKTKNIKFVLAQLNISTWQIS